MEQREIIPAAITAGLQAQFYPDYSVIPTVITGAKAVAVILTNREGSCVVAAHNDDTHYGGWHVSPLLHPTQANTTAHTYAEEGVTR